MPDIFLSYNREDQARAKLFAEALSAQGFSVWWDVGLKTGDAYDQVTEKALHEAKAVIVLWSKRSVDSRWVRAEATIADRNKTLLPCMIEPCVRPLMFELTQTADLAHWNGEPNDAAWVSFVADVRRFVEKGAVGGDSAKPPSASEPSETAGQPLQNALPIVRTYADAARRRVARHPLVAALALFTLGLGGWLGWSALETGAPAGQAVPQRIAFFGFTSASEDPQAANIAAAATNETFQAILALRLQAASRADTQGVELAQQRARAAELGAAYALGGEVRSAEDGVVTIQMHFEDVASRTTLWEQTVSGGAGEQESLPVLAAGAATRVARCMAAARPGLSRPDGDLLAQLATACATPYVAYRDATPLWRDLARRAPNSAVIQANFGNSLLYYANHARPPDSELPGVWQEARTAAQRALSIEPDNGVARTVLGYDAIFERRPLAEAGALMDEAVRVSPDDWRRGETYSNQNEVLQGVGRIAESLDGAQAATERDPLSPTPHFQLALALVRIGRGPEAGRVWEQLNARWPNAWWDLWAMYSVRYGISDIETVLTAAPPRVSDETKTCWRRLARAFSSSRPAVRSAGAESAVACGADGRIGAFFAELIRAGLLGDDEGMFAQHEAALDHRYPSNFLWNAGELFNRAEQALRANPRFLPLMKESGIYQYWLDTGTRPDTCNLPEERNFEVCASLRADQAAQ